MIYLKLAKDMTASQWTKFYGILCVHGDILERLKESTKPAEHWDDNLEEYFIMGSDHTEGSSGSTEIQ
jgi:hypothetical protein